MLTSHFFFEEVKGQSFNLLRLRMLGLDPEILSLISSTIIFRLFWYFLIYYQIFFSPQVKRCAIITYKHGIYDLPHDLPNSLRLSDCRCHLGLICKFISRKYSSKYGKPAFGNLTHDQPLLPKSGELQLIFEPCFQKLLRISFSN